MAYECFKCIKQVLDVLGIQRIYYFIIELHGKMKCIMENRVHVELKRR